MRRLLLVLLLIASPVWAVNPQEMLDDPVLEARAQALDTELRCVKCQSEAIASSNAEWAEDARVLVRELLTDGFTDEEVLDFFVARYGEFVLMTPRTNGSNILLYLAGPLMLVAGLGIGLVYLRRYGSPEAAAPQPTALNDAERERLREIMGD